MQGRMKKLSLSNKLKVSKKILRDCTSVNYAKVPRKLRSAMKKRNSESISSPLLDKKKRRYAIDSVSFTGDQGKTILRNDESEIAQITKAEEEAVETLFSLAKMLPNTNKNGFDRESAEAKSAPQAPEKQDSAIETLKGKCSIKPFMVQTVNLKPSFVSISRSYETEPNEIPNSKHLAYEEGATAIGTAVENLHEPRFTVEDSENTGLWPGLSSTVSFGAHTKLSPINSLTAYNSNWMSLHTSKTKPSSPKNDTLADKDSRDPLVMKKSWKRCLAHAHICRLINGLQRAEKTSNMAKIEVPKLETREDDTISKISTADKNQNENKNAILLHKRLTQDLQQPSPTSTLCTSTKQTFDFLSLSTGNDGVETTKSTIRTGNIIEPWGPFHIPFVQSFAHNHTNVPFSLPQSRYSTPPFDDHFLATAVKQVPIHLQSHSSNTILGPAQIQHQQRMWASQFASQYQPMGFSSSHTNPTIAHGLQPMYIPMNRQQGHNFIPLTSSLPNSRTKKFPLPLHLL